MKFPWKNCLEDIVRLVIVFLYVLHVLSSICELIFFNIIPVFIRILLLKVLQMRNQAMNLLILTLRVPQLMGCLNRKSKTLQWLKIMLLGS